MESSLVLPPNWALDYQQFTLKSDTWPSNLLKKETCLIPGRVCTLSGTKNPVHLCLSPGPQHPAWPHVIQTDTCTCTVVINQSQVIGKASLTKTSLLFWNTALRHAANWNAGNQNGLWNPEKNLEAPQQAMMVFHNTHNALLIPETHHTPDEPTLPGTLQQAHSANCHRCEENVIASHTL